MNKIILALTLSAIILSGCGNKAPVTEKQKDAGNQVTTQTGTAKPQSPVEENKKGAEETLISEENAKKFVLTILQGATEKDIRKFEKDFDDGKWVYDIEVVYNKMEYDFEINAQTGEIISWENEPVND